MEPLSAPSTPSRHRARLPSLDTSSPTTSHRGASRRRRSSNFSASLSASSTHDRSPITPRLKNRFSCASLYAGYEDIGTGKKAGAGGLGNLADELDELEDEDEEGQDDEEAGGESYMRMEGDVDDSQNGDGAGEGARDSGIDVSYVASRADSPHIKNFSKPFSVRERPPDEQSAASETETEDRFSPELDEALTTIARMAASASSSLSTEDPLIPRTLALLRDLGQQSTLEASVQRLTTSTNSLALSLTSQARSLQVLGTSLYSPLLAFSVPLDPELVDELAPLLTTLLYDLPSPGPDPLHALRKLQRDNDETVRALGQLTDALQMGRQLTKSAARTLGTTQSMVAELRRERERLDLARHELAKAETQEREGGGRAKRRCAEECADVMQGFEEMCEVLRESLVCDVVASCA